MFLNLHGVQGQLPCVTASVRIELSREIFLCERILQWLALHTHVSSLPRDSSEAFQLTRQTSRLKSR